MKKEEKEVRRRWSCYWGWESTDFTNQNWFSFTFLLNNDWIYQVQYMSIFPEENNLSTDAVNYSGNPVTVDALL